MPVTESWFGAGSFASQQHPRNRFLLGLDHQGSNDPRAALTGPPSPTFLLGHFHFFLVTCDGGYAIPKAEWCTWEEEFQS